MDSGQRICLVLLVMCGLGSLGGVAAPYWLRMEIIADALLAGASYTVNMGIVFSCASSQVSVVGATVASHKDCGIIGIDRDDGFDTFQLGRLLSLLGALCVLLLGPITCCACCCCANSAARTLGITGVIAGLMGVAGGAIFIWKTQDTVGNVAPLASVVKTLLNILLKDTLDYGTSFSWACYLYMVACSLLVIIGIILAVLPSEKPPTLPYVVGHPMVRIK